MQAQFHEEDKCSMDTEVGGFGLSFIFFLGTCPSQSWCPVFGDLPLLQTKASLVINNRFQDA